QLIRDRLDELQTYIDYRDKLLRIRLGEITQVDDLTRVETRLKEDLALPPRYEKDWRQTEAALLREKLQTEARTLRDAVLHTEDWFRNLSKQAEKLWTFDKGKPSDAPSWNDWLRQVNGLVSRPFPHPETEDLGGSTTLTYATVMRFDRVEDARKDWEPVKRRLEHLRDVIAAMGLAGKFPEGDRQPLDIPERCTLSQVRSHFQKLKQLYPHLTKENVAANLPEAVGAEVRRAARASYGRLVETGREV